MLMIRWVAYFNMNLGITTSVIAELYGLKQGLPIALGMGFRRVCVDLDASLLLDWVWGKGCSNLFTETPCQ
ncbi:hypothetical protein CDL15_Pgr015823 [Punica granatum]|uniref:RNase H type-1 domain-containing protein n=1 Tax=Punica granatum TaxID=22663 RepID=A0A218XP78_PUNGR|nr:hypothetical protein CDL15_Pgr015823 [Punica granatum]